MDTPSSNIPINWHRPPKVDKDVFIGVAWGGTALAALFLFARLCVRIKVFRRLFLDDLFVILAWAMFLTNTIIWQHYAGSLYQIHYASAGLLWPIPASLPADTVAYLKASLVVILCFYTSLWFVKFSFLMFFRKLGNQVKSQKLLWWVVFGITLASWLASFGTPQYDCLINDFEYIATQCVSDEAKIFLRRTLVYMMCIDVITDVLIISVPVSLLWNVKMSLRQKLALMGIFSLTVIIMIFAIVRVAVVASYSSQPDQSWLYLWTSIEQTIAIMVVCLASFRVLFVTRDGSAGTRSESRGYTGLLNSVKNKFTVFSMRSKQVLSDSEERKDSIQTVSVYKQGGTRATTHSFDSNEHSMPLRAIQVRNDVVVSTQPESTETHASQTAWSNC